MIQTILFPTDFTETSGRAGQYAEYLARVSGARVVVVHAVAPVLLPGTEEDSELQDFSKDLEAKAGSKIEAIVESFRRAGVAVVGKVVLGPSFETLVSVARDEAADLIVMGSHRLEPGSEPALGTLSHRVFFFSGLPVLFVR